MRLRLDRPIRTVLPAVAGLVLVMQATVSSQLVRTADATVRGLRENDFPRVVKLADDVYAYEDLNGDLKGNLAFTTNSLIVITNASWLPMARVAWLRRSSSSTASRH